MKKIDTLVIGSGPGGLAAAEKLAANQTVVVCENDLWGGTCPNRGCDPKKMLYSAVELAEQTKRFEENGLKGEVKIDWPTLMEFKESYTSKIPAQMQSSLKNSHIQTVQGTAQFQTNGLIKINDDFYDPKNIIIATGQKTRTLTIPGSEYLHNSSDFLSLKQMPKRIVVLGAGYIALELSNIARTAGANVDIIQHNDQPLKAFPKKLVGDLVRVMEETGINFHFNEEIKSVKRVEESFEVTTNTEVIRADWVLNATGRIPNIEELNLNNVDIETDSHGIVVNENLETSRANVYAIGDCAAKKLPKLTPVAEFEGNYAAERILGLNSAKPIRYPVIPSVVYSTLKLAQVGFDSLNSKIDYKITTTDVTHWYNYNLTKEPVAKIMTVIDPNTDRLAAGAILSSSADDMINQFVLLINQKISPVEVARTIFAYPSRSADLNYLV
ncbi:dihydrolipoyl dehydrogenase family protein [Xylocopilactobacillus apis]|uniref:Glutathione reductase n=1 Tax=Xylocopilactobacillus apis TaxID=2932183 RepID=A0AAU9CRW6_9LACO|nr:NAD(P)/FAD-dependent oxidoreductase [Xylocopilactobacillus apis]BDR56692.1 glutathione reductase [Xylocopilactobacillus apis]